MTLFLPRLDVEQLQEKTLFFLAEDPSTDGSTLDLIVKYFLTTEALIEKIARHPNVEQTTLNYIRFFGSKSSVSFLDLDAQDVKPVSEVDIQQKRAFCLQQLRVPEKVQLALKGNREARTLLLKDPNRQVVLAVLESPKLTEEEVETVAQSKSVPEEALRVIAKNPAWTRKYQIIEALVNNPKTPLSTSLGFLKHLRKKDLDFVTKNKGIPTVIRNTAAKMLLTKKY